MALQLNFALRTSAQCKTVHLLGSWDNYSGQLPLSKDSAKAGAWKGAFRFSGKTLQAGQRYWYYYILDGYHVTHDPAREAVVEPTTKRQLNVLDIPKSKTTEAATTTGRSQRQRQRDSVNVPKGRGVSPSRIVSPQPCKPHATRSITNETFAAVTVDQLTAKFATMPTTESDSEDDSEDDSDSDNESDVPSLSSRSSRSSNCSTPSSVSSTSSTCTCERYGITRSGDRVKLDCGGSRCGYSDADSCSSESEEEADEYVPSATRRHGMVACR
jgi:hypothetical protein